MAGYSNSVPLGQEGTGAAQILGPNRALQYFLDTNEKEQNRLLQEQQQFQKRQQSYGNDFQKTIMDINELANTPMFQEDFNALTNTLVKQGGELLAQGINPYNPNQNPKSREVVQQWNSEVNKLKQAKTVVDNIFNERKKMVDKYNSNSTSFDFDEYQKVKDFEKNFNLEDVISGRAQLPALQEIYDLNKDLVKEYGPIYKETKKIEKDELGRDVERVVKEPDVDRIQSIVNNRVRKGTPAGAEVDRQLRKTYGQGASMDGLLGTLDRDEIKRIIDSEFKRNTSQYNPIVELMSKGKIPSVNSPEYEKFLEKSVDEQLKAEMVLENAKQSAAQSLVDKVNTKDQVKFNFGLQNEKRKEEAHRANMASKSLKNTLDAMRIKAGGSFAKGGKYEALIDEANDVDFSPAEPTDGEKASVLYNAVTQYAPTVSMNPSTVIDTKTGKPKKAGAVRGNLTGVGIVAVDKNGNTINGNPEELANDPRVAKFEVKASMQTKNQRGRTVTDLYDPKDVPMNSFSKDKKARAEQSVKMQQEVVTELNNKLKGAKPDNTNKFKNVPKGGF